LRVQLEQEKEKQAPTFKHIAVFTAPRETEEEAASRSPRAVPVKRVAGERERERENAIEAQGEGISRKRPPEKKLPVSPASRDVASRRTPLWDSRGGGEYNW